MPLYFFWLVDNASQRIIKRSRFQTSSYDLAKDKLYDFNKDLKKSRWILACI